MDEECDRINDELWTQRREMRKDVTRLDAVQQLVAQEEGLAEEVLRLKATAVWDWADTVRDGELGHEEIWRLADGVDVRVDDMCYQLGVDSTDKSVTITEAQFKELAGQPMKDRYVEGCIIAPHGGAYMFKKLRLPLLCGC